MSSRYRLDAFHVTIDPVEELSAGELLDLLPLLLDKLKMVVALDETMDPPRPVLFWSAEAQAMKQKWEAEGYR